MKKIVLLLIVVIGLGFTTNAQNVISEPTNVKNNDNYTNFSLKKNSKIILDVDMNKSQKRKMYGLMEDKLRKLGFCCVYNVLDEIATTANIVIDIRPVSASCFRIQIFDKVLDRKVFDERYVYMSTFNKVLDNFIKDITPFIE